jgi:hypothetical protein
MYHTALCIMASFGAAILLEWRQSFDRGKEPNPNRAGRSGHSPRATPSRLVKVPQYLVPYPHQPCHQINSPGLQWPWLLPCCPLQDGGTGPAGLLLATHWILALPYTLTTLVEEPESLIALCKLATSWSVPFPSLRQLREFRLGCAAI